MAPRRVSPKSCVRTALRLPSTEQTGFGRSRCFLFPAVYSFDAAAAIQQTFLGWGPGCVRPGVVYAIERRALFAVGATSHLLGRSMRLDVRVAAFLYVLSFLSVSVPCALDVARRKTSS